jgi:hypothetical protein
MPWMMMALFIGLLPTIMAWLIGLEGEVGAEDWKFLSVFKGGLLKDMEGREMEEGKLEEREVGEGARPCRIDVFGFPETFAVCVRSSVSDVDTWPGFCGIAYSVRRVWIGTAGLDSVAGTISGGIGDVLNVINRVEDAGLYKMDKNELFKILLCELPKDRKNYESIVLKIVSTDLGWEHKLTMECECFDGFHIFGVTSGENIRFVFFNNDYPENSFDYIMKKDEVREVLLSAQNFIEQQVWQPYLRSKSSETPAQ